MTTRVLLVDNFDSFSFNLVQALRMQRADVVVKANDECSAKDLDDGYTHLVVSPGPGHPTGAGASLEMIEAGLGKLPILGVCLGHQSIAHALGANVSHASRLMHGKSSPVYHDRVGIFEGLPNPFDAARYHSLAIESDTLPDNLAVSAYTSDGEVMGVRHKELPVEGVQFHPESILTPTGAQLLRNFLELQPAAI